MCCATVTGVFVNSSAKTVTPLAAPLDDRGAIDAEFLRDRIGYRQLGARIFARNAVCYSARARAVREAADSAFSDCFHIDGGGSIAGDGVIVGCQDTACSIYNDARPPTFADLSFAPIVTFSRQRIRETFTPGRPIGDSHYVDGATVFEPVSFSEGRQVIVPLDHARYAPGEIADVRRLTSADGDSGLIAYDRSGRRRGPVALIERAAVKAGENLTRVNVGLSAPCWVWAPLDVSAAPGFKTCGACPPESEPWTDIPDIAPVAYWRIGVAYNAKTDRIFIKRQSLASDYEPPLGDKEPRYDYEWTIFPDGSVRSLGKRLYPDIHAFRAAIIAARQAYISPWVDVTKVELKEAEA